MSIWSTIVDAFRTELSGKPSLQRNPWPQCPACWHRVPALCPGGDDGQPCGFCRENCCPRHRRRPVEEVEL